MHPQDATSSNVYEISVPFLHCKVTARFVVDVGLQQEHWDSPPHSDQKYFPRQKPSQYDKETGSVVEHSSTTTYSGLVLIRLPHS